ncbi:hypothetical protein HUJ04_002707 [Dendroctonus ponderosae]|nr:hypothetical protein HUJ04_002707 [Dendroctonus ponderosae]
MLPRTNVLRENNPMFNSPSDSTTLVWHPMALTTWVVGIMLILPAIRALSDEMKELAQMLHNTCVAETGVNEDFIRKVNAEKIFADDENLKCYIKCLMAQMACIDDNGIIDEEATIAILPEEYQALAAPVIRACGTKHGANPCENAWLSHRCYAEMEPSVSG